MAIVNKYVVGKLRLSRAEDMLVWVVEECPHCGKPHTNRCKRSENPLSLLRSHRCPNASPDEVVICNYLLMGKDISVDRVFLDYDAGRAPAGASFVRCTFIRMRERFDTEQINMLLDCHLVGEPQDGLFSRMRWTLGEMLVDPTHGPDLIAKAHKIMDESRDAAGGATFRIPTIAHEEPVE